MPNESAILKIRCYLLTVPSGRLGGRFFIICETTFVYRKWAILSFAVGMGNPKNVHELYMRMSNLMLISFFRFLYQEYR